MTLQSSVETVVGFIKLLFSREGDLDIGMRELELSPTESSVILLESTLDWL